MRTHGSPVRWLAALVALVVVSTVLAAPVGAQEVAGTDVVVDVGPGVDADAGVELADRGSGELSSTLVPVSGVRDGAPTIIGGAVVNGTDEPVDVTVRIESDDIEVDTARPTPEDPEDGSAWACDERVCRLVDPDGDPLRLAAQSAAQLMLALRGPGVVPGGSVEVRVGDLDPVTVPLDRPDGAAPMAPQVIGLVALGADEAVAGAASTSELEVTNLGADPLDAGTLVVTPPFVPGDALAVTVTGDAWTCDGGLTCTYGGPLAPLDTAPPLQLTVTPGGGTPDRSTLAGTATATATSGDTPVTATTDVTYTVRQPVGVDVSVQLDLEHTSISAPDRQLLLGSVIALGSGPYLGEVVLHLDADEHVRVDWERAGPAEQWSCDAASASCTATSPIPFELPTTIELPVEVDADIEPGMYDLTLRAELPDATDDDEPRPGRANTQTLVVNPPPVAELRATLAATGAEPGGAVELHAPGSDDTGAPVDVVVTNQGSRPAPRGAELHVELRPDGTRSAPEALDDAWTCRPGPRRTVDAERALRCVTTLTEALAPGATRRVPLSFDTTDPGTTTWNVRAGVGDDVPAAASSDVEVVVSADGPVLSPTARVTSKIVRHGNGTLEVHAENRGRHPAEGGVLVIETTEDLTILGAEGDGWRCVHAGFRGSNGSLACATRATVEPGGATAPLHVELAATTDHSEANVWLWSTTGGQAHPRSERTGRNVTIDLRGTAEIDAGEDRTVISPVRGPDGTWQPATVTLHGAVDMASAHRVRWTQVAGPAVTWHDADQGPTRPVATFTAPTIAPDATGPVALRFRLAADYDSRTVDDEVEVQLVRPGAAGDPDRRSGDAEDGPPIVVADLGDPVADVPADSDATPSSSTPSTAAPSSTAPSSPGPSSTADRSSEGSPSGSGPSGRGRNVGVASSGSTARAPWTPGRAVTTMLGTAIARAAQQAVAAPEQLCRAAAALAAGSPATVTGAAGSIRLWIPAGTAAPRGACGDTTSIDVTGATVSLPGGTSIAIDGGALDRNGLRIRNGQVDPHRGWKLASARVPAGGLTLPFAPPTGGAGPAELSAASLSLQFVGLPAGLAPKGATTVTFDADGAAALRGRADAPAVVASGSIQPDGALLLDVRRSGAVRLGGRDIPVSSAVAVAANGTLTEPDPTRRGALDGPLTLPGGVTVASAQVEWTSGGASAAAELVLDGPNPATLRARLTAASAADAAAGTWTVQLTEPATWSPWGAHGPSTALRGDGTLRGDRLALTLTSDPVDWSPVPHLALTDLTARVELGAAAPTVSFTGSATAPALGATTATPVTGTLDPTTGASDLTAAFDTLRIASVELADVTTTVHTDDTAATVRGQGSTSTLGTSMPATLELDAARALVLMDVDHLRIVDGWTVDDAHLAIADVDTTHDGVELPAGRLIGVGGFTLPDWLRPDGMPDTAARGTMHVDLSEGADHPTFHLTPEDASGWVLAGPGAGGPGAGGSITVDDLRYDVAPVSQAGAADHGDVAVSITGTATVALWRSAPAPVTLTGSLAAGPEGPTMNVDVRQLGDASLGLGPSGAPLRDLTGHVDVGAAPSASLHATATLPGEVTGPVALPAGTERPVAIDLTDPDDCLTVTLTDDDHAVDVGSAGLLVPTTAVLAFGPEGCTVVDESTTGTALHLYDPVLGHVAVPLDPATLTGWSKSELGQVDIGGVDLHDTRLTVTLAYGTAYLDVDATVPVDRGRVTVRGKAAPDASGHGRLHLDGGADELVIGERLTLRGASLSIDTSTTPGVGAPDLRLTGTATILGTPVEVSLSGPLSAGAITSLTGSVASTRFALPRQGSLTTALQVIYDRAAEIPLTISSVGHTATLETGSRTWPFTAVEVDRDGFDVQTQAPLAGSFQTAIPLAGRFATAESPAPDGDGTLRAGDYVLRTVGEHSVSLDGFAASTTAEFTRRGGDERNEQRSVLPLGVFDTDVPVVVKGAVDAKGSGTLTGAVSDVRFRGLRGDVEVAVRPDASATGYRVEMTLATRPGTCDIWRNSPTLTGRVYRLDVGTLYELTGTASLKLPYGMDAAIPSTVGSKTFTLENVSDLDEGNELPAPGAKLEFGITTPVFSAKVSAAFYLDRCAYTVAGEATVQWGGGAGGSALARSFAPIGGATVDLTDQLRYVTAASLHAEREVDLAAEGRARRAAKLKAAATSAQREATMREGELSSARHVAELTESTRSQAEAELRDARRSLASKQAQLADVRARDAELSRAKLRLARAEAAHDVAAADAGLASMLHQEAQDAADQAQRSADQAAKRVTAQKKKEQLDERKRKTLSVGLAWTHCQMCSERDLMEVSGALKFALIYTAGVNLRIGIDDGRFASALGTVSLGLEAPLPSFSAGPLKVAAEAGMSVYGTLGYRVDQGWTKLLFGVEGSARLAVQMSLWFTTLKATIAGAKLVGEIRLLPAREMGGSYKFEAFGLSKKGDFGPWWP